MIAKRRMVAALALFWAFFCLWVAWGWLAVQLMREPLSTPVREATGYEIRLYGAALAAQVQVHGSWSHADELGGRLLRAYAGEALVLDGAPLTHEQKGDGSWLVSLVLPPKYTDATVPRPNDPQVRIVTIPKRAVAVIRFSGESDAVALREHELRGMLARDRVLVTGTPRIVYYDAPLVPPFMRMSELLIPVLP